MTFGGSITKHRKFKGITGRLLSAYNLLVSYA